MYKEVYNYLTNHLESYAIGIIWIIAILFSSLVRPELSNNLVEYFDKWYIKLIIYVSIVYIATNDITTAILVSVCFYVLISMLSEKNIAENFLSSIEDNLSNNNTE